MPNPHSPLAPLTFCARRFSISELEMLREVAAQCSTLSLTELSRTLCELLDWKRPNGKSDTPREAGGLVSGTASKAVAQVVPSSR
jgi:hypothetical protein